MNELSKRLDLPGAHETTEDIINYQLEPLGVTYQQLRKPPSNFPLLRMKKNRKKGFELLQRRSSFTPEPWRKWATTPCLRTESPLKALCRLLNWPQNFLMSSLPAAEGQSSFTANTGKYHR